MEGLNVDFDNNSSNGTYYWTFGDGSFTYETQPTHAYVTAGTYQVCLTVSGSCGSDIHCESIQVTTAGSQVLLDMGEVVEEPGQPFKCL
ncbi:MAG: PKD domain-containing protein [Saprospiraceae bacterium]